MKEAWNFDLCVSVLTGEIELLKKISAAQDKVRQTVLNREWADFDEKIAEVNRMGEEFTLLENERVRLFSALAGNEEKPFYSLIMGLPEEENRELSGLYRELKMESLKMRALNENFMAYLNEARTMAAAYLEAVCPARGGKLYTRKGHRVSQDLRSIVINNRF
jgi:hypothetical protein